MKEAYIYVYVNKNTKKTYIGSRSFYKTTAEEDFNKKYKSSSKNKEFLNDMKFGLLDGQILFVIKCEDAAKRIVKLEHQMIKAYWDKYGKENSYNHYCNGNFSMSGLHHSEELKEKWSKSRRGMNNSRYGKHLSEEQKEHLKTFRGEKSSMFGKHLSDSAKKKIGEAAKLRGISPETRAKISKANKGRKVSDETKEKISNTLKGRKLSKETIMKMKKPKSEEHLKKLRQIFIERNKTLRIGCKHKEETKQKIRESNLGKKVQKYIYLDSEGIEHIMCRTNVKRWHPDWIEKDIYQIK